MNKFLKIRRIREEKIHFEDMLASLMKIEFILEFIKIRRNEIKCDQRAEYKNKIGFQ